MSGRGGGRRVWLGEVKGTMRWNRMGELDVGE